MHIGLTLLIKCLFPSQLEPVTGKAVALKIHPVFVTVPNPIISSQLADNIFKVNTVLVYKTESELGRGLGI